SGGFGLYLHWPFCESKCPYCDFNSHVRTSLDQSRWLKAYLTEIDRYADLLQGRVLNSIFFGGGTPSLMEPSLVAALVDRIRSSWPTANDLEVTLEANPSSVEAGRFADFAQAGVARVSMGIQALNDDDLRRLGRLHTVAQALQALDIAQKNFSRVSFDLIYARQGQRLDSWQEELRGALRIAADHLSLYQLTIEPETAFGDRHARGGLNDLPDDDLSADMFITTQEICATMGYEAYEVSNHAKPGAESRHNLTYWRYGDYVGIGPGAHGRITLNGVRHATEAWANPERWLQAVPTGKPEKLLQEIPMEDQAGEYLMMGLRIQEGIEQSRYKRLLGSPLPAEKLSDLKRLGLLRSDGDRLSATWSGRLVLNAIIKELLETQ
ncbi:MAG: radical SAM family heme chaperone HemW, partial [Pseudomonadota bacterium]